LFKKVKPRLGMVLHTCNPSYSGGRDQEDGGPRPALDKKHKIPSEK
jgi:hypothetical protein